MEEGNDNSGRGESFRWDGEWRQQQQRERYEREHEGARQQEQRQWQSTQSEKFDPLSEKRSFIWPLVATFMAALAIGHVVSLRRRLLNFERLGRQEANSSKYENNSSQRGSAKYESSTSQRGSASSSGSSTSSDNDGSRYYRTYWTYDGKTFYQTGGFTNRSSGRKDDPWSRIWREGFFEEELARLERLRRMQEAFLRERAKYTRNYEWPKAHGNWGRWHDAGFGYDYGGYQTPGSSWRSDHTRHYEVLGLDPSKAGSYSQAEIKKCRLLTEPRLWSIIQIETSIVEPLLRQNSGK